MFKFFNRHQSEPVVERDEQGRKIYRPMSVSPEAYRRIAKRSEETGDTILEVVDKLTGVR